MNENVQPENDGLQPAELPAPRPDEIVETISSKSEDLAIQRGLDLKTKQTDREIQQIIRGENAQGHIHKMVIVAIYAIGLSALAMFLCLVWHYITPYEFLSQSKLDNIKQILFSGTLGAALSGIMKKYLGFDSKKETE